MSGARVWDAWLLGVAAGMAAFGVGMALFAQSSLFDGFNAQIDPVFWATRAIDPGTREFRGWVYGVWGATVAGFGLLAAFVARGPFRRRERWARDALLVAAATWFALDTAVSASYGVWFNVAFNTFVLLAIVVPIGFTWKQFSKTPSSF